MKSILYKNSYPRDFVEKCVKEHLNIILTGKVVESTVPKKNLMMYYHIWVNFAIELIVY